jgi:hypothetical protein
VIERIIEVKMTGIFEFEDQEDCFPEPDPHRPLLTMRQACRFASFLVSGSCKYF